MKRLLRTVAVTFAQYSRIPMPRFEWQEEDMRCSMAVFPWVGAVIGLLFCVIYGLCIRAGIPETAAGMLLAAVPVLITGGFHIDGFMDVSDAVSSYRSREEKLAILKDPHIGAFAVIRLALCGLIYLASVITVLNSDAAMILIYTISAGFFLSRAFSAVSVLTFKAARKEGMLYYEATAAGGSRTLNLTFDIIWLILAAGTMIFIHPVAGSAEVLAAAACFLWYRFKSYREFGGITGDTAGWFVTVCETAIAAASAVCAVVPGVMSI